MGRKRKQQITGPDYLVTLADQANENGQPFAWEFKNMVTDSFMGSGMRLAEITAARPLREHEASPVSIILAAYRMAQNRKDRESADEVVQVGLSLLAKWPAYLLSMVDGHPDFVFKESTTETRDEPED